MKINGFEIDVQNQYKLQEGIRRSTCPLCSAERKKSTQKCLSVFWDTGMAKCSHCGEVLQLHTYKKKKEDNPIIYKKPEWKNNTSLSDNLTKWFEGRGISQFTLRRLKVTEGLEWMPQVGKETNTIQFNYFRDNELINVKYRDARKNFKLVKDAEKIPYNLDNIRTTTEAIIVEGEIDALSCVECGRWDVVSSPNGSTVGNVNLEWLDNSYEYFENKDKIFLALDDDDPGQNVQNELIRRLGAERCFLVDLKPFKDFNEVLSKEGKDSVLSRLENSKQCPLENVVKFNDLKNELHNFYINGSAPGFQIGLKPFDEIFSTYTSQFIVVTGIPGHGKSEFVDQMTTGYALKYQWKTAYCSPENKPNFMHADKLCRRLSGYKPKTESDLANLKWVKTEEYVNKHFFFIDYDSKYDLKSVLKKGAELVKRKGIKCLVIDPFNKINLKESNRGDINQYTNDYLSEIDAFCRKYDVLVIIVAHPIKMKKINGVTPEPDFYDIKGGGEWFDMSYHGLLVHRNFDSKTVKIKTLKVKFANLGTSNMEANFAYHCESGRYCDILGDPNTIDHDVKWDNTFWLDENTEQSEVKFEDNNTYYEKSFEDDPFGGKLEQNVF